MNLKNVPSIFSISYIKILSIAVISVGINYSHGNTFNECFPDKYNFVCSDPNHFFKSMGIDPEQDILSYSDIQQFKKKPTGHSKGGIYRDRHQNTFFVKQANPMTEFIGSKLMNLIVGTTCTPIVKVIGNRQNTTASQSLANFRMQKEVRTKHKKIKNEAELAVAMDFLGIVDRNPRNMGYVRLNSKTLLAARVDFDASFGFASDIRHGYVFNTDHLNLKQLYRSARHYPKNEISRAIRKIIDIPDDKIIMTIFQSWVTLSHTKSTISLDSCFNIAQKLIERKNAFREALTNSNSLAYQTLQQNYDARKIRKKHGKKRHHNQDGRRYKEGR